LHAHSYYFSMYFFWRAWSLALWQNTNEIRICCPKKNLVLEPKIRQKNWWYFFQENVMTFISPDYSFDTCLQSWNVSTSLMHTDCFWDAHHVGYITKFIKKHSFSTTLLYFFNWRIVCVILIDIKKVWSTSRDSFYKIKPVYFNLS
jgi:hypothetical protein